MFFSNVSKNSLRALKNFLFEKFKQNELLYGLINQKKFIMNFVLYFLVFSASSKITILNKDNYEENLDREGKKPLFLKIWSPWCTHCQSLAPIYFQLSEIEELNSKIEFAEFNCDEFPSQCKKLADNKVPTFFYYDSNINERVQYIGDDSIDSFTLFLKKHLNQNLVNITNENEKKEIISSSDYGIIYIFSLPLNDPSLDLAINFSNSYKQTNKRFFIENNSTITEKSLIAYHSHNYYVKYEGNWSKNSISDFIFENYFPLIENVGPEVIMISSFFKRLIVLIGVTDKETREKINEWNLDPRSDVQYCVENVLQPSTMSFKLIYNLYSKKNNIVVIDFMKKVSWSDKSIQFSKSGVDKLINLSLNDKELKHSYGPGNPNNSIVKKIRFFYVTKFGLDWSIYLFATIAILFVVIIMIAAIVISISDKKSNATIKTTKND